MNRLTLSVLLLNYNQAHCVERALESVVGQSRPPDEFIVVDDDSTDESPAIIQSYAERYPYLRFVRNPKNKGAVANIVSSQRLPKGDWLFIISADDYALPGAFESAMALIEQHPKAGIAFGPMHKVDERGKRIGASDASAWDEPLFASPERFLEEYLEAEQAGTSASAATFYRREALQEIGYQPPELGHWCDTFALRAIGLRYGACYTPTPIAAWTKATDTLSQSARKDPRMMLDIVARAEWLMRSERFRDDFPSDHVDRWARAYRARVLKRVLKTGAIRRNRSWWTRPDLAIRGWLRIREEHRALCCYRGDTSCYADSPSS
jgi:glycosyltransferase involved in cell wall biosynthesis